MHFLHHRPANALPLIRSGWTRKLRIIHHQVPIRDAHCRDRSNGRPYARCDQGMGVVQRRQKQIRFLGRRPVHRLIQRDMTSSFSIRSAKRMSMFIYASFVMNCPVFCKSDLLYIIPAGTGFSTLSLHCFQNCWHTPASAVASFCLLELLGEMTGNQVFRFQLTQRRLFLRTNILGKRTARVESGSPSAG